MGDRQQRGVRGDLLGDLDGVVAGAAAGPVRDRDEGRTERLQLADRVPQPSIVLTAPRWKELEGERRLTGVQTLADGAWHAVSVMGRRARQARAAADTVAGCAPCPGRPAPSSLSAPG